MSVEFEVSAGVSPPDVPIEVVRSRGDRDEAFVAFVDEHGRTLHRVALLLTGDGHRAEELLQNTLEKTYRSWDRAADGDPLVYARRILANARIDAWRRSRRLVPLADDALHAGLGARPDASRHVDVRDELVRALRTLPAKQRRVVVLRHLLDLSEAEVADELGVPVGTVKSTASRALARLRTVLTSPTAPERNHDGR